MDGEMSLDSSNPNSPGAYDAAAHSEEVSTINSVTDSTDVSTVKESVPTLLDQHDGESSNPLFKEM